MDKKVTSIVCYITWIGWLIAFLAGDKEGAKVHLNQALVLVIGQFIIAILNMFLGGIIGIILSLISLFFFVCEIIGIIWAAQGQDKELPLIGGIKILK
ncbi:MAG: hypothetical protein NC081_08760 [Roseburia sp.]|nr:hypothetical protein [Roseburia sp.]